MPAKRVGESCAARATEPTAGSIDSSSGSASVAPAPRRNVRRASVLFVMKPMASLPPQSRADAVVAAAGGVRRVTGWPGLLFIWNGALLTTPTMNVSKRSPSLSASRTIDAHDRHVVVLDAAAERVRQQLLGDHARELVLVAQHEVAQIRRAVDLRAVVHHARRVDRVRAVRASATCRPRRSSRARSRPGPSTCGSPRTAGSRRCSSICSRIEGMWRCPSRPRSPA